MKRYAFLLSLGLLFITGGSNAQAPEIEWIKTYGCEGPDNAYSLIEAPNRDLIIIGETTCFAETGYEGYIIRTNPSGKIIWQRQFRDDGFYQIAPTLDDFYIIVGTWALFVGSIKKVQGTKIDNKGNKIWQYQYGKYNHNDWGRDVAVTDDNGFIFVGYKESTITLENYLYIVRTDAIGHLLWEKSIYGGCCNRAQANSIIKTHDGFLITGSYDKTGTGDVKPDLFILKMNDQGDSLWMKTIGDDDWESGVSIIKANEGNYAIGGSSKDYYYLVKINDHGDTLWTKEYRFHAGDVRKIAQTNDGGYILVGGDGYGDHSVYVIRTDIFGDTLWTKTIENVVATQGADVIALDEGGYYILANTKEFGNGYWDICLIKLAAEKPNAIRGNTPDLNLFVTNNPAYSSVKFRYSISNSSTKLELYDLQGRQVDRITLDTKSGMVIWSAPKTGIYFARIAEYGKSRSFKFLIFR